MRRSTRDAIMAARMRLIDLRNRSLDVPMSEYQAILDIEDMLVDAINSEMPDDQESP